MKIPNDNQNRAVTLIDVANQCGVSYQTVSRVINGSRGVADATRLRIMKTANQLGYRPNMTARHLVSRRSTVVGLVTFGTRHYGPSQTMINVEEAAKAAGYSVMFAGLTEENVEQIRRAVNKLCAHQVAGVLMHLPLEIDLRILQDLCRNIPFVALDSDFGFAAHSVLVQQDRASQMATRYLINLGHRKIAYLRAPLLWRAARLRYEGWLHALKAARLIPGPLAEGDWTSTGGFEATLDLLKHHRGEFTALLVANDQMALGAIRALEERGLRVPVDVSVVGFDNIPEAGCFRPPLSTVSQDFAAVAKLGFQCLMDQLAGVSVTPKIYTVKPTFVERLSATAPARGRAE
jgi:DNA-binding LacI/PurR family transcriptional regulator